jgi:hypothetical protein
MNACAIRFASDCFVNLSAFVLTGSHLVLFNTKAESIYRPADYFWFAELLRNLGSATNFTDLHGFFLLRRNL